MTAGHGRATVQVGARVVSADGKQLGVVKDAMEDRFKVDVRWAPDYWLGTEIVDEASPQVIHLMISKQEIGSAKLTQSVSGPGLDRDAEDLGGPAPHNRPPPTI